MGKRLTKEKRRHQTSRRIEIQIVGITRYDERPGVPTQGILEDPSEDGVPIRHENRRPSRAGSGAAAASRRTARSQLMARSAGSFSYKQKNVKDLDSLSNVCTVHVLPSALMTLPRAAKDLLMRDPSLSRKRLTNSLLARSLSDKKYKEDDQCVAIALMGPSTIQTQQLTYRPDPPGGAWRTSPAESRPER